MHAEDEAFDVGEEAGDVVGEVEEVMVEVVAEKATVEGFGGRPWGEGGGVGAPDYGAGEVGEPPDARVFGGGPEGGWPGGEDGGEGV